MDGSIRLGLFGGVGRSGGLYGGLLHLYILSSCSRARPVACKSDVGLKSFT